MHQYRITIWLDEENSKYLSHLYPDAIVYADVTRQKPLTQKDAEDIVNREMRELHLEGKGKLEWQVYELKEILTGTTDY